MKHYIVGLMLTVTVALSGCLDGMDPATRAAIREAAVLEMEYRIDQLQAVGLAEVEVDPTILIAADAACSFLAIGSPFMVEALNRKTVEKNAERPADDQSPLLTVEEFQANLHAVCDIVRKVLKSKEPDAPAPEVAPTPEPAPVSG